MSDPTRETLTWPLILAEVRSHRATLLKAAKSAANINQTDWIAE